MKKILLLKKIIKKEDGAALVVEAALVYPIIFFLMGFMIYIALFMYQNAIMHDQAKKLAMMSSRIISFPGYYEFGDIASGGADFDWANSDTQPTAKDISDAYGVIKPYRYFLGTIMDGSIKNEIESNSVNTIDKVSILGGSNVTCDIDFSRNCFLNKEVQVTIKKELRTPQFFAFFNLTDKLTIKATAKALSSDSAEFIRNTDMGFDLIHFLAEKLKINDMIDKYKQKLQDALAKFNIKPFQ